MVARVAWWWKKRWRFQRLPTRALAHVSLTEAALALAMCDVREQVR